MTMTMLTEIRMSDADLVSASREGNREAFGQIVRRYQGMIAGLIYAACGDLHRSEDLAQETFLSAWKSLSGLRDPGKLPAWLCQIARHRAQDQLRKTTPEKVGVGGFWTRDAQASAPPPDEAMVRKEEEAVLWRALSQVPQPYRETLVLYYRQGRSTAEVALATETSEVAVRQRLTRGREMLRGEVSQMIERNLERSAPNASFAPAVIAALPALAPHAAATAGVATTAKTAAAAHAGWLSVLLAWVGTIGGVGGGLVGSIAALKADRSPQERKLTIRFLIRLWLLVAAVVILTPTLFAISYLFRWSDAVFIAAVAALFSGYWALITLFVARYQANSRAITHVRATTISFGTSLAITVGPTIGALAWLIHLANNAGDRVAATVVIAAILLISLIALPFDRRAPHWKMTVLTIGYTATIAAVLNWRLDLWIARFRQLDPSMLHLPLWSVDCAAVALVAWSILLVLRRTPAAVSGVETSQV